MYARSSTLAILAAMALALPANRAPRFTLETSGAIVLNVAGDEAQYGLILSPGEVNRRFMFTLSLGATNAQGSLMLYVPGDHVPRKGRYPIHTSWNDKGTGQLPFQACFVAGSPEHPLGWFHGESGWVTITDAKAGRMSGEFEIRARGFMSSNPDDENRWVTVRGTFEAHGDSTIATIASLK